MELDGKPNPPALRLRRRDLDWKIFIAGNHNIVEVVGIKLGFAQQRRPSPNGEG